MKISERRLRQLIRGVIKESRYDYEDTSSSYDNDSSVWQTARDRRNQRAGETLKHRARQDAYNRDHQEARNYFVTLGDHPRGNENLNGLKNHLRSVNLEWNVNWEDHVDGEIPAHVINDIIAELDAWLDLRREFSEEDLSAIDGLVDAVSSACEGTCNSIDTNEGPQWLSLIHI